MKTTEFLDQVCGVLNRPPGSIHLEDTPETVVEWDSLGHLAIIGLIDSLFNLAISDQSLQHFTSIQELLESLRNKGFLEGDAA